MKMAFSPLQTVIVVIILAIASMKLPISKGQLDSADIQIDGATFNQIQDKKRNIIKANTFSHLESIFFIVKVNKATKVRLGINRVTVNNVDERVALEITTMLHEKLQARKGKNSVVYRKRNGISKSINRQLAGRISKLGKDLLLSIKVIEVEKGKLLFSETIIIKKNDDLDDVIDRIVDKICKNKSIW